MPGTSPLADVPSSLHRSSLPSVVLTMVVSVVPSASTFMKGGGASGQPGVMSVELHLSNKLHTKPARLRPFEPLDGSMRVSVVTPLHACWLPRPGFWQNCRNASLSKVVSVSN